MATFGGYETTQELHRSGLATTWAARPVGAQPDELAQHFVKAFKPLVAIDAADTADKVALFLEAARVQKLAAATGSKHWAPILESGTVEGGAYYVSTHYHRSLEQLIHGRVKLSDTAVGTIIGSIVQGLVDLRTACTRSHGALKPANVLVDTEGDVTRTRVVLCDPAPTPSADPVAGEAADVRAVGRLLYQLVLHKPFQIMGGWPVPQSTEWSRLGRRGEAWRELCSSLLDPNASPEALTLDALAERVAALYSRRGAGALLTLAVAAVVVAALAVAGWHYWPRISTPSGQPQITAEQATANWKQLCTENLYWFATLHDDLADSRRRKRWATDDTLAAVIKKIDAAESQGIMLNPSCFADDSVVSLEDLSNDPPECAKTDEATRRIAQALAIVQDIKKSFRTANWPELAHVAAVETEWKQRGWLRPAAYLHYFVFAIEPRRRAAEIKIEVPSARVAREIDKVLALRRTALPTIEAKWQALSTALATIATAGDPILKQFAEACPAEMKSADGKGRSNDLEELKAKLDDVAGIAAPLASFVEGDWKTRVAQALFLKDSAADRTFEGKVTRHTIGVWQKKVEGYYKLAPADDPRGTQADWDKKFAAVQAELDRLAAFSDAARQRAQRYVDALRDARQAVARLAKLPAIRKNRTSLAGEAGRARKVLGKIREDIVEDQIRYLGDPADWYRSIVALEFKASAALNTEWQKRRGQLLKGIKPEQLKAQGATYRDVRPKADKLRDALNLFDSDKALPCGMAKAAATHAERPFYKAFAVSVAAHREQAIASGLSAVKWRDGLPHLDDERFKAAWQNSCSAYRTWRDDVAKAVATLGTIEDGLDALCLPHEKPQGADKPLATLLADLRRGPVLRDPALARAIEPLAARIQRLRKIGALADRKALTATALKAPEPEVVVAAWRRLGALADPPWPNTAQELKVEGEVQSRLASELRTVSDLARRKALQDALATESRVRRTRWLTAQAARLEQAIERQGATIVKHAHGDKILAQFPACVAAELAKAGKAGLDARAKAAGELKLLADRVAAFVQGDWQTEVDRDRFASASTVHTTLKPPVTRATVLAWLKEVKDFYRETPKQFAARVKAIAAVSKSTVINREWVARRDRLLIVYPTTDLDADRKRYSTVRRQFQQFQEFLGGLDDTSSLPVGLTAEAKRQFQGAQQAALGKLLGTRREQALKRMIAQIPWGQDGFPAVALAAFKQRDEWVASCKQYTQFRSDMQSIVQRTQAIGTMLDAGYLLDDKPAKALKTPRELYADWKAFTAAVPDLASTLAGLTARVDALVGLEHLDRALLVARARALKPADPPQVAMVLWLRLGKAPDWPKNLEELALEAALRKALAASARTLGARDPHPVRWVQPELAKQGSRRWEVCFCSLVPHKVFTDADEKALGEAIAQASVMGVDRAKLCVGVRFRWRLYEFRKAMAALPDKAKRDAVAAVLTAFIRDVEALPGGMARTAPVAEFVGKLRAVLAQKQDDTPGGGLDKGGPAVYRFGGGWKATPAPDGKSVVYTWGGKHALHFARVEPAGGEGKPSYLCTTEMSLGLFIDVVTAAGKWGEVTKLLRDYDPLFDPRKGPRVWVLTGNRNGIKISDEWLVPLPGVQYYPDGFDAGLPALDHPMQYVSPEAALYVARLLGGRLPTVAEWRGAYAAFAKGQAANLRDATWKGQQDYIRQLVKAGTRADWPDAGAFLPNNGAAVPAGGQATVATKADDAALWLAPVGTGPAFRHLVGNVAEFVYDEPARFEQAYKDGATLSSDSLTAFLDKGAGALKVVGGSALSPPELWNGADKPFGQAYAMDLSAAREGYADVGFRLAFSAPRESLLARARQLVKKQGYVPALQ